MASSSFCKGIESSMHPEQTDSLYAQQVKKKLSAVLELMDEMEREVLQMRLGLIDGQEMAVDEVAAALGESRQQIRKWEKKALRIMHHPELTSHEGNR